MAFVGLSARSEEQPCTNLTGLSWLMKKPMAELMRFFSKAADLGGEARGFGNKGPNGRLDALSSLKEGVAGKFARGPKREAHVCRRAETKPEHVAQDTSAIPAFADIGIFS